MTNIPLAVQHSPVMPTRKLAVGAAVAALATTYAGPLTAELWPQIMPHVLAGPVMTDFAQAAVGLIAGVAVAWFIRDRANVPVSP